MTHWTPDQRADAIGRALALGADKAAEMTGIPRRTISSWLARERPAPELDALIVATRSDVADRLWEAVQVGTEAVLAGLRDPKARLGDKAQALRIVAEQYALLTGGATSRSENLNVNVDPMTVYERGEMTNYVESLLAKIDSGSEADLDEVERQVGMIVDAQRQITAAVASGEAETIEQAAAILTERLSDVG